MTPAQHQKLAALRRMANHASTPENERASAKRRIAEMEEKYGASEARDYTDFIGGFTITFDTGVHEATFNSRTNIPPRPFVRAPHCGIYEILRNMIRNSGSPGAQHRNCRCYTVPFDEPFIDTEAPFSGTRLSEFADYILSRWNSYDAWTGPYGKVRFVVRDEKTDDAATFRWFCTAKACCQPAHISVDWREAGSAQADSVVMDQLFSSLSAIWAGHKDNRCSSCSRSADVEQPKEEDNGYSSSDGEG